MPLLARRHHRAHSGGLAAVDATWRVCVAAFWLACHTQDEIAAMIECDRHDVDNFLRKSAASPDYAKPAADHLTDFQVPLYNIWHPNVFTRERNQ